VNSPHSVQANLDRLQRWALTIGAVASVTCVAAAFWNPGQFFRSYLVAYLLWSGITLGCLEVVMLHHLVGGGWGYLIRRLLESGAQTWPLLALLTIPVVAGLPYLYLWAQPAQVHGNKALQFKQSYLNPAFFCARMVFYLVVWGILAHFLTKWSSAQDVSSDPVWLVRLRRVSGPGLVFYWITVTFASIDLVMSLEPDWYSTIFSAIFIVGQALSSVAFVTAIAYLVVAVEPLSGLAVPKYLNDLGNILLMLVMLWAYMQFGQLLIIWSGNLTDEIPWYLHRINGGWVIVSWLLFFLQFAIPFLLLLQRPIKRTIGRLSMLAAGIVVCRLLEMIWLVEPSFDAGAIRMSWMDWALPVAFGGIWIAAYVRRLKMQPMLPLQDPRLPLVFHRIAHPRVGDV
jgi:hypothetical protein